MLPHDLDMVTIFQMPGNVTVIANIFEFEEEDGSVIGYH